MIRQSALASALALSVLLGGCAASDRHVEPQVPMARLQDATITGQAAYRERIALLPGSTIEVTLNDISRADAPAGVLASERRSLDGEQVPLPFSLKVKEHHLKTNMRYSVRATITDPDGRLVWTTDRIYPVDPAALQQDLGILQLVKVAHSASVASLTGPERTVEFIAGRPVTDRSNVTVTFTLDGQVSGSTGCNRYSGAYSIDGQSLRLGPLAMTKRACGTALADQEQRFLGMMQGISAWQVDQKGRLVLSAPSGQTIVATGS